MNAVGEPGNVVPCAQRLGRAKLQGCGVHACHGALRFKRSWILAAGLGDASSSAKNRVCAASSRKKVRWSRIVSSARRRALSSMNSESFWPRNAAARLSKAFASAEARIWITSSLRRVEVGIAHLKKARLESAIVLTLSIQSRSSFDNK